MVNNHWLQLSSKEKQSEKARFNKVWDKILKGGGSGGTSDYNDLDESTLPKLEESIVKGSKQAADYNLMSLTRLKAIVDGTDSEVKIKNFNGESIFQTGTEPSHMTKVPYVIIKNEGDFPPYPYKKGDLLVGLKNNLVQDFKICIKDCGDVYEASDWLDIGNNNIIPVRKQDTIHEPEEPVFKNTNTDDEPVLRSSPPNSVLKAEELADEPEYTNNYDEFFLIDGKYEKIGIDKYDDLQESSIPSIEGVKVKGAKTAAEYNLVSLTALEGVFNTIKELLEKKQDLLVDTGTGRNIVQLDINGTKHSILGDEDIVISTGESTVVNADWLEDDETKAGYIKNKPLERLNTIETDIDRLKSNKQDQLISGVNIRPIKVGDGEEQSLLGSETINIPTGEGGGISTYAEAPDKPQLDGKTLEAGNNSLSDLNIAKADELDEYERLTETLENGLDNAKEDIIRIDNSIGDLGVRIDNTENLIDNINANVSNIESKICTDFYKTSTIKSPSCKAVADYIDTVLADLDGSEEAF